MLAVFERIKEKNEKSEIERKLFNNDKLIRSDSIIIDFNQKPKHKWINIFQGVEVQES
jgi:hypothetical protein